MNDLAILKLNDIVQSNQDVQFACLPRYISSSSPPVNSSAWVVGWGTTTVGGEASDVLRNIKIQVYDSSDCSRVSYEKNWNAQICAGEKLGGRDSCQGDSGGGLFINDTIRDKQRYIVSGIVSYGDSCGMFLRFKAITYMV